MGWHSQYFVKSVEFLTPCRGFLVSPTLRQISAAVSLHFCFEVGGWFFLFVFKLTAKSHFLAGN